MDADRRCRSRGAGTTTIVKHDTKLWHFTSLHFTSLRKTLGIDFRARNSLAGTHDREKHEIIRRATRTARPDRARGARNWPRPAGKTSGRDTHTERTYVRVRRLAPKSHRYAPSSRCVRTPHHPISERPRPSFNGSIQTLSKRDAILQNVKNG